VRGPSIAIARPGGTDGALDLDGFFGLHPRMAPLKPLWDRGRLAIVHASGSHDTTRSHFDAQDYMESATPGVKSTRDGWLNRYLQAEAEQRNPLRAVALTRQMPRALQGRRRRWPWAAWRASTCTAAWPRASRSSRRTPRGRSGAERHGA
jgi:uncharacterized protein (DUF1501 family)